MAFHARQWVQQPGRLVGPSDRWLQRGMVALFDQRNLVDVVSGNRASYNTGAPFVSQHGRALDYSGTANTQYPHASQYAVTGALSIACLIEVDSLTNYGAIIAKQTTTTTNTPYELRLGSTATNARISLTRANTGYKEHRGVSNAFAAGYSGPLVTTYPAGGIGGAGGFGYSLGGAFPLTDVIGVGTVGSAATDDAASSVWIGRRYNDGTRFDGRILFVALFSQELTPSEARALVLNPWQLFAPRRIWVPQAGLLPTLSLPTYTPGSLTATGFRPRVTAS